jgi:hypothetical protein
MDYLFIDESGNLGKQTNHFIISGILIKNDFKALENVIKKTRRNYKEDIKRANELKAYNNSEEINHYLLSKLNETKSKIFTVILKKENLYKLNFKDDKNLLYDIIASRLAKMINIDNSLEIRIDKSKPTLKLINNFNKLFLKNLNNKYKKPVKIYHSHSHAFKGLQVADCIAYAYFQKYEYNNKKYVNLLKLKKYIDII